MTRLDPAVIAMFSVNQIRCRSGVFTFQPGVIVLATAKLFGLKWFKVRLDALTFC